MRVSRNLRWLGLGLLFVALCLAGCGQPTTVNSNSPRHSADHAAPNPNTSESSGEKVYPEPDVSKLNFATLSLKEPSSQYKSRWNLRAESNKTALKSDGLSFDLVSGPANEQGIYGGVSFPVSSPKALRLDVTFRNPKGIAVFYVDGYPSVTSKKIVRWQWRSDPGREIPEGRGTYILVPGKGSGYFHSTLGDSAAEESVKRLDLFVRANPSETTGFTVHKIEVGN